VVLVAIGAVVHRSEFRAANIAHSGDPAVIVGSDDDVGELRSISQATERLDVDLEGVRICYRGLRQDACGHLHVLCSHGRNHVTGRKVVRGDLIRIEPYAHGVVARAERLDVAHAI